MALDILGLAGAVRRAELSRGPSLTAHPTSARRWPPGANPTATGAAKAPRDGPPSASIEPRCVRSVHLGGARTTGRVASPLDENEASRGGRGRPPQRCPLSSGAAIGVCWNRASAGSSFRGKGGLGADRSRWPDSRRRDRSRNWRQGGRSCSRATDRSRHQSGAADRSRADRLRVHADAEKQGRQTDQRRHATPDDAVSLAAGDKHVAGEAHTPHLPSRSRGYSLLTAPVWPPMSGSALVGLGRRGVKSAAVWWMPLSRSPPSDCRVAWKGKSQVASAPCSRQARR